MKHRATPTLVDYLIIAVSPLLIMLMIGSLVFFVVEVLYAGDYTQRLLYTLFFFVIAAVLTARIAMELGSARAGIYALALGVVTFLALQAYVRYPSDSWLAQVRGLVHVGLLALIGWCAHKLTWDCTYLDRRRQVTGRGLLTAISWLWPEESRVSDRQTCRNPQTCGHGGAAAGATTDETVGSGQAPHPEATATSRINARRNKKRQRRSGGDSRLWAWIEAYQKYREQQQQRPHIPGVWVLYCTLAALPLFALGQSLIDPQDTSRRRATLWQMATFIGSALGLLATTSLLGLRHYLRQRRARIPTALAVGWLAVAGLLVALFLTLGMFLPRPHAEVPWFGLSRAGSSSRSASHYAVLKDSPVIGEGQPGQATAEGKGNSATAGRSQDKSVVHSESPHSTTSSGKGKPKNNASTITGRSADKNTDSSTGKTPPGATDPVQSADKQADRQISRQTPAYGSAAESVSHTRSDAISRQSADTTGSAPSGSPVEPPLWWSRWATVAKWVVFVLVAVGVAAALLIAMLRGLAPFTRWAARWLEALHRWWHQLWPQPVPSGVVASSNASACDPPPWSSFSNPYTSGAASQLSVSELIDYTLQAWEAWAHEQGYGRRPSETVWEFLCRVGQMLPESTDVLQQFAWLHAQANYSAAPLSTQQAHLLLRRVWAVLTTADIVHNSAPLTITD